MTKGVNVRSVIVEALQEILENGQMCHQVLSGVLDKYQYLEKQERAFLSRSVEGVMEYLLTLDYILDGFSKTPVKKMKPFIRNLLRMSLYHLFYMDSVPERAVVSEAVKLAEKKGFYGLKGFVNGLLRNIIRNKEAIAWPENERKRMEIQYSVPGWILDEWFCTYEKEEVEELLRGLHRERPLQVCVNVARVTPEECKERLKVEGAAVKSNPYLPECLEISGYDYLGRLASFREGLFQVQDVSSMLAGQAAVSYLNAKEKKDGEKPSASEGRLVGEKASGEGFRSLVLDMCGAPGGKTLYVAEHCPETLVLSRDISGYKLSLIEENVKKSGVNNVKTEIFDALQPDERRRETADVVLADLPCSGLGILGKKRDIAYKTTAEDVKSLAKLQREMLSKAAEYVKPGGLLLYSTCTITRAENTENRAWFLHKFPFKEENICSYLPEALREKTLEKGYLQLLPGRHASDGFFICAMKKNGGDGSLRM